MGRRIGVEPYRIDEPLRAKLVTIAGEDRIAAYEQDVAREIDLLINGDPDIPEPLGIFHGSDLVRH